VVLKRASAGYLPGWSKITGYLRKRKMTYAAICLGKLHPFGFSLKLKFVNVHFFIANFQKNIFQRLPSLILQDGKFFVYQQTIQFLS